MPAEIPMDDEESIAVTAQRPRRRSLATVIVVAIALVIVFVSTSPDRLTFRDAGAVHQVTLVTHTTCGRPWSRTFPDFEIGGTRWTPKDPSIRGEIEPQRFIGSTTLTGSFKRLSADTAELHVPDLQMTVRYVAAGSDWLPLVPICSVGS